MPKDYTLKAHDNGTYYVHWTDGRRTKRVSARTKSLGEAQAFLRHFRELEEAGEPAAETVTIKTLWDLKHGKHISSTAERIRYAAKLLLPVFGHLEPRELNQGRIDDYIQERLDGDIGRGAGLGTIRFELAVLLSALNHGVKKRLIPSTDLPVLDPLPEQAPPRTRWLRTNEIETLFAAAEAARLEGDQPDRLSRVERFIALALYSAARRTAILELTWRQVDLEDGLIHYLKDGETQTKKRKATVPISPTLRPILERAYRERRPGVSSYVIDHPGKIYHELDKVLQRAGEAFDDVTPHVLRHTAATHMARNGVSLWLIAQILGNTMEVVERTYAKFAPSFGRDAVAAIPAFNRESDV